MSGKKHQQAEMATATVEDDLKTPAIHSQREVAVPEESPYEYDPAFEDAGTSDRREDNVIPFLTLAQKNSPQVNNRDTAHIPGLQAGMIFNTATGQYWDAGANNGPLLVQAHLEAREVEWGLRDTPEQGFKGRHPIDTPLRQQIKEVPRTTGRGMPLRILPNGHQLVETRMHYFVLANELQPVAYSATSSALNPSKQFNTIMRTHKYPRRNAKTGLRELAVIPAFEHLVQFNTRWTKRGEYDWYVPNFVVVGKSLPDYADAREEAMKLFLAAKQEGLRVAQPTPDEDGPNHSGPTYDPDANPNDGSPL